MDNIGIKSNIKVLTAKKSQHENRRMGLLTVARETGLDRNTIWKLANNDLQHIPATAMVRLCRYFGCNLNDLFQIIDSDRN